MNARAPANLTLLLVFLSLLGLLTLSAASSFFVTGPVGAVVALGLAAAKMSLIFAFFMRLRYQSGLVRLFACAGFFWFGLAITFALADYLTRR
jgi:cytochrome c oxidase subunit 4